MKLNGGTVLILCNWYHRQTIISNADSIIDFSNHFNTNTKINANKYHPEYDILPINSSSRRVLAIDNALGVAYVSKEIDY